MYKYSKENSSTKNIKRRDLNEKCQIIKIKRKRQKENKEKSRNNK